MNKFSRKKNNLLKPGFTMIEIIVVLLVVSIGIMGVMALVTQNVQSQSYDKNNLIASQLAQEGIEMIRMVRDTNWKQSDPFNAHLISPLDPSPQEYYMDYLDTIPHEYSSGSQDESVLILKKDDQGFYRNSDYSGSASSTIFSRLITITRLDLNSFEVDSKITWLEHARNRSYNLKTILYDWK